MSPQIPFFSFFFLLPFTCCLPLPKPQTKQCLGYCSATSLWASTSTTWIEALWCGWLRNSQPLGQIVTSLLTFWHHCLLTKIHELSDYLAVHPKCTYCFLYFLSFFFSFPPPLSENSESELTVAFLQSFVCSLQPVVFIMLIWITFKGLLIRMSSVTFLFPEEFSTLELSFTIAASHSDSSASSVSVFFYPSPTPPFQWIF